MLKIAAPLQYDQHPHRELIENLDTLANLARDVSASLEMGTWRENESLINLSNVCETLVPKIQELMIESTYRSNLPPDIEQGL